MKYFYLFKNFSWEKAYVIRQQRCKSHVSLQSLGPICRLIVCINVVLSQWDKTCSLYVTAEKHPWHILTNTLNDTQGYKISRGSPINNLTLFSRNIAQNGCSLYCGYVRWPFVLIHQVPLTHTRTYIHICARRKPIIGTNCWIDHVSMKFCLKLYSSRSK